jgi:hypothetical protein
VPCEEALQFYVSRQLVFNRVYGLVNPLIFRLEEVKDRPHVANALQAASYATLAACLDIHEYHVQVEGGKGPSYDCIFAEAGPEDGRQALAYACEAELAFGAPHTADRVAYFDWLQVAVDELQKPGVKVESWISAQPRLSIPYAFRR